MTRTELRAARQLKALLDHDGVARLDIAMSYAERIERLVDEARTETDAEMLALLKQDVANVKAEARRVGIGAREIAAAPAAWWAARKAA